MCAVNGSPFSSSILSALPWSAVIKRLPFISITASASEPTHASTVSTAFTAAGIIPVWPTISQFAKLTIIASYLPLLTASLSFCDTSGALISGIRSKVEILGDATRILSSPSYCFSSPPLKKKVT